MATIQGIYIALFGRPADPLGLDYFNGVTNGGRDLSQIGDLASQPEYFSRFEGMNNSEIVISIYQELFGRNPDAAGLAFFTAQLNSGAQNINTIAINIYDGAQNEDLAILEAKEAAANQFTDAVRADNDALAAYQGQEGIDFGNAFLDQINSGDDVLTDEQVQAQVEAFGNGEEVPGLPGQNSGETFTLTTGIDNIVGTDSNDTFVGTRSGNATSTLQSGDVIDGGAGTDTLRVVASSGAATVIPTLTSVETLELNQFANTTYNLVNSDGIETIVVANGNSFATIEGLSEIVDLGVSNTQSGGVQVFYNGAAVAGTSDVQNISLNDASSDLTAGFPSFVQVDGVETMAVTATGTNNAQLLGDSLETVTVAGAGDLNVTNAFSAEVETFDASASTGDVSAAFIAGGDVTATGGAGDDEFSFFAGLNADDVVNGGGGFDTVRVSTGGNLQLAADAAAFNQLTSIERVAFDGASVQLNGATFTNAGITNIEFNTAAGGGGDVINNAGSARTYEFGVDNGGAATFNLNGTSTTLNIDLLGTEGELAVGDGDDADVGALTINLSGTQPAGTLVTVNLTSMGDLDNQGVGDDASFNNVGQVTAVAGSTFIVDGSGNLDIAGFANRAIVNASALTGDLVIEGSDLTPGATVSGADTITLGAGEDVVQFSSGLASGVANNNGVLIVDIINGFTAGEDGDVLDFTGVAGDSNYTAISSAAQAQINALSGSGATLQAAANIAADLATVDEWTAFTFQGQTYAQYDADGNGDYNSGTDLLVQITGVTVASLTDDNFA